jgi:hypothetical protein
MIPFAASGVSVRAYMAWLQFSKIILGLRLAHAGTSKKIGLLSSRAPKVDDELLHDATIL